jgi:hypothetical protein
MVQVTIEEPLIEKSNSYGPCFSGSAIEK